MSKYDRFEDLPVWQEAARLYNSVLDLVETPGCPFSNGFRHQIDRAALSVSNNIAEGFDRRTTAELLQFIGFARGSAGEVRSMTLVIANRPRLQDWRERLTSIRCQAESCSRQLNGWRASIEAGSVHGNGHQSPEQRELRATADKAAEFRRNFLRNLKPEHPLYNSPEARIARGESPQDSAN